MLHAGFIPEPGASDRKPFAALNADPRVMEHFTAPLSRHESDTLADRIEVHESASLDVTGFVDDTLVRRALEALTENGDGSLAARIDKRIPVAAQGQFDGHMAFLKGFGAYLPARVVGNQEMGALAGAAPDWILNISGIEERRYADDDESVAHGRHSI